MARGATKAVGNLWYEARKKAAIYNGRLCSREGAAEMLGIGSSRCRTRVVKMYACR